ncbi:hypothetical protein AKJ09_03016 [Labilithrix luteola]|uniref:Uncharacterized protein n=2 Tax=Labilithrix luteola TaxID=1391654 RepID=A0A0K1PS56_9BACT|nr:hypothetical protein AKJ09_03016 [Labilithrix luteola]
MLALGLGVLVVAAVPITMKWRAGRREEGAVQRLLREKQESLLAVTAIAKSELGCEQVEVKDTTDGMVATGCEKVARYVASGSGFRRDGEIVPAGDADDTSGCKTVWAAGRTDASTAEQALAEIHARGKTARLRVPIERTDVRGLAKLRFGKFVAVFSPASEGAVKNLPVPCGEGDAGASASADGGAESSACTLPFEAVTEIADCP